MLAIHMDVYDTSLDGSTLLITDLQNITLSSSVFRTGESAVLLGKFANAEATYGEGVAVTCISVGVEFSATWLRWQNESGRYRNNVST